MKIGKHDHKLTDLLKVGIFSILMLAPMIAIGVKCAYVVVNKNAYLNYSGQENEIYEHVDYTNLQLDKRYHWANGPIPNESYTGQPTDIYIENVSGVIGTTQSITSARRLRVYRNGTNYMYLAFYDGNDQSITYVNGQTTAIQFNFTLTGLVSVGPNDAITKFNYIYNIDNSNTNYMDNVFYSATNDIKNSTLFNWTENTAIYTTMTTMTQGMGITDSTIPLLLTYWSLLTAIYIVFDIIISIFSKLTHLVSYQKD